MITLPPSKLISTRIIFFPEENAYPFFFKKKKEDRIRVIRMKIN